MKKVFLMAILAIAGMWSANAQKFGIKAGYNHANLNGKTPSTLNFGANHGFYVGALLDIPILEILSLQPEVLYSRQGTKTTILGVKNNLNMDYLNIPVMAKLNLGNFSILAGPQIGFLVNNPQWKNDLTGTSVEVSRDAYAKFDAGLGIGAMFKTESGFFIDARYTYGLVNTFDKNNKSWDTVQLGDHKDFKNSVLSVGVGFLF